MKIGSIIAGLTEAKAPQKRAETIELLATKASQAHWPKSLNPAVSATVREALGEFDVTNITPDEFAALVQRLYQARAVTEEDYRQLSAIRAELSADGIRGDERVNLVEFYARKLRWLQSRIDDLDSGEQEQLATVTQRLDWVQKLAAMRRWPQGFGLAIVV